MLQAFDKVQYFCGSILPPVAITRKICRSFSRLQKRCVIALENPHTRFRVESSAIYSDNVLIAPQWRRRRRRRRPLQTLTVGDWCCVADAYWCRRSNIWWNWTWMGHCKRRCCE